MGEHEKSIAFATQKLCFQGVKAIVSHRESYHFTWQKLCFHGKKEVEKAKKVSFSRFSGLLFSWFAFFR